MRSTFEELNSIVSSVATFTEAMKGNHPINTHTMREIKEMNEQASRSVITQAEIACLFGRAE